MSYSLEQRILIVELYMRTGSFWSTCEGFLEQYPVASAPSKRTIQKFVEKWRTTGSVSSATGSRKTPTRIPEAVADTVDCMERSHFGSTRGLSRMSSRRERVRAQRIWYQRRWGELSAQPLKRKRNKCVKTEKKIMFPHSSLLDRCSYPPKQQQNNDCFTRFPVNLAPVLFPTQQLIESEYNFMNANFHHTPLNVLCRFPSGHVNPSHHNSPHSPAVPTIPQGRKRRSDEHSPYDIKRQRFSSPHALHLSSATGSPSIAFNSAAVPLQNESRNSTPSPSTVASPHTPKPSGCVPPLYGFQNRNISSNQINSGKDKLSQQIFDLFHTCQQQQDDLEKKEFCRAQLQREIQTLFPTSRVYLAGSSLNGFGTRSSDADLCLVVQDGPVNQKSDAVYILSLVQQLFYRLPYIERPHLIRAKVPILKFRDKVSGVEFDLNVNNVVGIRNTFLLRTYAYVEKRVRPIILVVKKWARHRGINDASRGTLSSYSLVLMVLHYLQTLSKPVIPSLQKEYPESFNPTMQLHLVHEGPSNIPPYISKNGSTLGELFQGFLKYYATVFKSIFLKMKAVLCVIQETALPC
ncbi:poly(A) RNA polymerase GLD2 isoform X2 [Polypterus senegalus]|uniref:poly(A) RNA polymerase GLD2 isoform X2 n=1 Tax=Polypterus senegalus TaxID=55291 RepID=UPI001965A8A0|nr:poly(A) RNA polymerase GLD2 isoform X2 [Polypterus senegalus]